MAHSGTKNQNGTRTEPWLHETGPGNHNGTNPVPGNHIVYLSGRGIDDGNGRVDDGFERVGQSVRLIESAENESGQS